MLNLFLLASYLLLNTILVQENLGRVQIQLLPSSELLITGSTNVNKFACNFEIGLISEPRAIKYTQQGNEVRFSNLFISLNIQGFNCGNNRINSDFQDLLRSEKHPDIKIILDRLTLISEEYSKAFIKVELAGIEKAFDLPVQLTGDRYKGKFRMNIRDFGLEPPKKVLGLIEVNEMIEINFQLRVLHN